MSDKTRKSWGAGRVAFMARLDTIRSELGQGLPLTVIYARHKAALRIGYPSFCKLVARYADDAKVARRRPHAGEPATPPAEPAPHPAPPADPGSEPQPKPTPQRSGESSPDAGHSPAIPTSRTFRHSPVAKKGEVEQLLGPGFIPKRK